MSSSTNFNADEHLSRGDKWYLGGGDRLVWTPRYPKWLDVPGFWDEAHYYHHEIAPVFAVALLDEHGDELPVRSTGRRWKPSGLRQTFTAGGGGESGGLFLEEVRSLLPEDVLLSEITVGNRTRRRQALHVVVWTMLRNEPEGRQRLRRPKIVADRFEWTLERTSDRAPRAEIGCALGVHPQPVSTSLLPVEEAPFQPKWSLTPFYDTFQGRDLAGGTKSPLDASTASGPVYAALHVPLDLAPGESRTIRAAFGAAPDSNTAGAAVSGAISDEDASSRSAENWAEFFSSVPSFVCSNPHLQKYYWYRWYGLHLFTTRKPEGNFRYPAVYEGPGYFRKLVTFSAQCHMLEMRWMHDPAPSRGSLLNFIHNQRPDGSFVGHLFPDFGHKESFYHADWGRAWDVHLVHPDDSFLASAFAGLSRYAAYFQRKRDPEGSGLYDILNHYETGQEYMHRYVAVEEKADEIHWGENFRLKGVDAAVYMYETHRLLARIARRLGLGAEEGRWAAAAEKTSHAVRSRMWDPNREMFSDIDARSGRRTGVKAAVCFYPYMTDIVGEEHVAGLKKHLLDSRQFWTKYPVPSSSLDDPYFSGAPIWKGRRMNCPWNGRVWPMANSHVAEALAQSAIRFRDQELREKSAEFMDRFIRMMFFGEGSERPNCFEHYNPFTGKASVYRGVDDYQHSWVADLIIKYVCGVRPNESYIIVDPFPFDLQHFRIENILVRGHRLAVERERRRFCVWIDGREAGEQQIGNSVRLEI